MRREVAHRIAFAVASALESRIILDNPGAEKLVGKGDMLWYPLGSGKPLRVQGCLIDDAEVLAVSEFVKGSGSVSYDESIMQEIEARSAEGTKGSKVTSESADEDDLEGYDSLFLEAVDIVLDMGQASVSMLQRRLKLGYARAARLVDQMEERGVVGAFGGSKPRQLLMTKEQWAAMTGLAAPLSTPGVVMIELVQLFTLLGRSDIDDLILNTAGAAIGYLVFRLFVRWTGVRAAGSE